MRTRRSPMDWRLWVELTSNIALGQYMDYKRETNRSLAAKAGLSHSIVAQLRCGLRKSCKPTTASAIERALSCPPNVLFVPKVHVARTSTKRLAVAA